jgi:hypothetical protein
MRNAIISLLLLVAVSVGCNVEPVTTVTIECEPVRLQVLAYLEDQPAWSWGTADYPRLTAEVLDITGQPLDVSCPNPPAFAWERPAGTATCRLLGDTFSRAVALKCTAPGDIQIDVTATIGDDVLVGRLRGRVVG